MLMTDQSKAKHPQQQAQTINVKEICVIIKLQGVPLPMHMAGTL